MRAASLLAPLLVVVVSGAECEEPEVTGEAAGVLEQGGRYYLPAVGKTDVVVVPGVGELVFAPEGRRVAVSQSAGLLGTPTEDQNGRWWAPPLEPPGGAVYAVNTTDWTAEVINLPPGAEGHGYDSVHYDPEEDILWLLPASAGAVLGLPVNQTGSPIWKALPAGQRGWRGALCVGEVIYAAPHGSQHLLVFDKQAQTVETWQTPAGKWGGLVEVGGVLYSAPANAESGVLVCSIKYAECSAVQLPANTTGMWGGFGRTGSYLIAPPAQGGEVLLVETEGDHGVSLLPLSPSGSWVAAALYPSSSLLAVPASRDTPFLLLALACPDSPADPDRIPDTPDPRVHPSDSGVTLALTVTFLVIGVLGLAAVLYVHAFERQGLWFRRKPARQRDFNDFADPSELKELHDVLAE